MIASVFSPEVFGKELARALDGLLAVLALDAQSFKSSPVETVELCGSMCLEPSGDDFFAADQLSRHFYTAGNASIHMAHIKLPGLAEAIGDLNVLDIRKMLKERYASRASNHVAA